MDYSILHYDHHRPFSNFVMLEPMKETFTAKDWIISSSNLQFEDTSIYAFAFTHIKYTLRGMSQTFATNKFEENFPT